ncbi:MAG: GGDEF domain-containing protein [Lachnospiraceae bacterium]|nr:GGDEF domain-containing protein [Lachnospiraceae bacterium]
MRSFIKKYWNFFIYGGVTKQEYQEIAEEVREKNRSSLSMASICLVIMFAGLFLGSLLSEMMAPNRKIYGLIWVCFLIIQILCQIMKKKGNHFIVPLWYVAMTGMLAYAIILNTILRRDISATTFCVIMIAAPLLVIDRPWRLFGYFFLVLCFFIPVDFHQKAYYLAYTDTVNALCCIFLGSAIHMRIMRIKMREMIQKRYIERERDTDKLTGCFTKAAFERMITKRLHTSEHHGILLIMDLDYFKSINDNYGHVFGDMVLHTMGDCIRHSFPDNAMAGRFGGDEFQVWIPGEFHNKEIISCLNKFLADIRSIETPDNKIQIGASIGVAVCPVNGDKYSVLFENADAALYSAKNLGRNRYVFCPEMRIRGKV